MKKYILEPHIPNLLHAGSKAREDINFFLGNTEYEAIVFNVNDSKKFIFKVKNYLSCLLNLDKVLREIKPNSIVLIQYPYPYNPVVFESVFKKIQSKGVKLIALVHDINSLRFQRPEEEIKREIDYLNSFHYVISHNQYMTEWLVSKGLENNVIDLEVFDYRMKDIDEEVQCDQKSCSSRTIVFAGNLSINKSQFLYKFSDEMLNGLNINLYGIEYDESKIFCKGMNYKGAFQPDELPFKLDGDFGLVWDGEETHTCSGHWGQYLRFNNPHKLSLYLAAGMPVITWKNAAISRFIDKNKIGVLVDSLSEISEAISEINEGQYLEMRQNVKELRNRVTNGHYIQSAIKQIEESFNKERENAI